MAEQKKNVDIKCGSVFPFPFLVLGAVFFIAGAAVFVTHPVISIVLIVAGVVILTAYEGTEINPASRTYREYNSFLFIKKGKAKKYNGIEKIFINKAKVSQRVYTAHTSNSAIFTDTEYNAYLKFNEGEKVFLFSGKNKTKLLKRLNDISRSLNTQVVDNTGWN
ncbi:MAG: hypothetical protein WD824_26260 [Cyclobacteriaceae bacterium]